MIPNYSKLLAGWVQRRGRSQDGIRCHHTVPRLSVHTWEPGFAEADSQGRA